MSSMEEIHVRLCDHSREQIIQTVTDDLIGVNAAAYLDEIHVWTDSIIETDFRIHLHWSETISETGSDLAHHIVNGLQSVGSIKHSIWYDIEETLYQNTHKENGMIQNTTSNANTTVIGNGTLEREKRGFRIHRTVYMVVIPVLATINILVVPEFLWFFFPLAGWGFGLTMHYVFGVRRLEKMNSERNR